MFAPQKRACCEETQVIRQKNLGGEAAEYEQMDLGIRK